MCPRGRPRGQGRPKGLHLCRSAIISTAETGVAIASDDAFSTILTRKRDDQFTLNDFSL